MVETTQQLRVLMVEDDEDALFLVGQMLSMAGYPWRSAGSASGAQTILLTEPFEVVIADISMPDGSGLELLRWVRQQTAGAEVIMLTGSPSVQSAIEALRDGAVDYLTKPVTAEVLTAALRRVEDRIRLTRQRQQALTLLEAGLRQFTGHSARVETVPQPAAPALAPANKQYRIGPVLLDLDRFSVEVNGHTVHATPSEIEILHYLCRNPGRVITPQEMVLSIRGYRVEPHQAPEIIRPHISNLRRKLMAAAAEADVVRTVRGVGYMLKEVGVGRDE